MTTMPERKLKCGHMHHTGLPRCGVCDRCWDCCTCKRERNAKPMLARSKEYAYGTHSYGAGQQSAYNRYMGWWKGKLCRANPGHVFKRVVDVKLYGPPSFVYGGASMVFEDGTEETICSHAYIPRKYDVEVQDDVELH